jgi:hypothetical protein
MHLVPIPCCDQKVAPPQLFSYRANYQASTSEVLQITVPPGVIEFQWTPQKCTDFYSINGCECAGHFAALQEIVYYDGIPLTEISQITITLPPNSGGQLCFRALEEITPTISALNREN